MREFRGDGGRESASSNTSKAADAASEFQRMDWKGSSDRELNAINNNSIINIRTDRKDARGDHRGGGGTDGREVPMAGRRGESRSGVGGDNNNSGTRERKSSDDLQRVSSSGAQETGQEMRESWGGRTFLKSISSSQAAVAAATAAPTAKHGGEEDGEIGDFTDDGGGGAAGGGAELPLRFEETKRKRDERGGESRGVNSHINTNNNSINSNNVTDREERQRDKSERRGGGGGGDVQVHISFVPPSQQQHLHRDKEREEKQGPEREKAEKEATTTTTTITTTNSNSKQKEKDKVIKEEESSAVVAKEKGGSGGSKEIEVESRSGDKEGSGDGYNSNWRKEAAAAAAGDQEEKDQNKPSGLERVEKRGGLPLSMAAEFDQHESAAGTSGAGGGGKSALQQVQEENSGKVGGEVESKERAIVESKEQLHDKHEKVKNEPIVEEEKEKEKGKRKLRDYDRAAAGGDDANNNNNGDGGEDFEREVVSSYGIQRKRLLRPRGHYQGPNTREVRPRFRVKDPETPVRSAAENSTLVYRVGEGLQEELRRIRKEYIDRNGKLTAEQQKPQVAASDPPTIEVRIPVELATTSNRQVQGSQLWGTDVYTDDSDLVAILMHTGYYAPTSLSPANTVLELRATVKVLAPQERYTSTLRNSLRSRSWGAASGCSLSVESCYLVKKDGGKVQLEPRLTFTPAFAPTLAPAVTERTVTTRAVSMNAYRAQRFVQEVTIQYNLCNEPWLKYSMNIVADKGLKKSQYTSARLKKNDVLYVETHFRRFELSFEDPKTVAAPAETKALLEKGKDKVEMNEKSLEKTVEKGQQGVSSKEIVVAGNNHNNEPVVGDKYRWALCKWPLSLQSMRARGVPLSLEYVKVLESGLAWEEVQWSPAGVCVRGKEYPLARAHFVPMQE